MSGDITFTITVKMKKRWIPHFLGMLWRMEHLGTMGSSRLVTLFADGDSDFRPKFLWDDTLPLTADPNITDADGNTTYDAGKNNNIGD